VEVAQRLKRRYTIVDKLFREPRMDLARMDDVAGCRLIFQNITSLKTFRRKFLKARFNHLRAPGDCDHLFQLIATRRSD
jgi:ppGpp synthetase/RelA/SpoT-type nucleotidyltranferase